MNVKHELQSIISRVGDHATTDLINAAAYYIRKSQETSGNAQEPKLSKEDETKKLIPNNRLSADRFLPDGRNTLCGCKTALHYFFY